ncbi:MAG: lactamase [Dehalococcoidales bacterium]|nr:lactamase [Dehalococcoidales bacterium]
MDIKILGAHNTESKKTRMSCILIDGKLVLDAGGLTSSLSLKEQTRLKAICLTHAHYDHVRDIPALGMNLYLSKARINICATKAVYGSLTKYLINDDLYPDWFKRAVFNFITLDNNKPQLVSDYTVKAMPVNHSVPSVGLQIKDSEGKTIFYTGDTGAGLADIWPYVMPQLLIIEVTAPNRYEESIGNGAKHLTPRLLKEELISFRKIKGYLPKILLTHMNFPLEDEIAAEIEDVAVSLKCSISLAHEGMRILL